MSASDPIAQVNALNEAAGWPARVDPNLKFLERRLLRMVRVWNDLVQYGRLPARADLTARGLRPYLRNLVIMWVIPGTTGMPRRYLHRYIGGDIRIGQPNRVVFEDYLPPDQAALWSSMMSAVVDTRRALRILTRSYPGRPGHVAEMFAAPLANDGVNPDRVMTISYFSQVNSKALLDEIEGR